MPERIVVTSNNELKAEQIIHQPGWVQKTAQLFSWLFHPLFIPVYITLFLIRVHPYLFSGFDDWAKMGNLLQVFVNCTLLPLVSVLLLRGLKFIDSVQLKTQKERIVPYMICMIFYFWNWYAFKNNHGVKEMISLSMAIFNASVFGFLVNISMKVSMHAMAAGVMSCFMTLLAMNDSSNLSLYLSVSFLIAGMVCTSRLIVSGHTSREVYTGLLIGIFSQVAAHYFVSS
jgi:hypothetical protein